MSEVRHLSESTIRGLSDPSSDRPAVTVIVPSYNYARFLTDCTRSVLSQRDVDVRLIVIDDGSSDGTAELLRELSPRDARVAVIRNEPNLGQIPSVNLALEQVETPFVVKLDADDLIAPGALARATALLNAFPEVGFVYGRPQHFTGAVPRLTDRPARTWTIWPGIEWLAQRCRAGTNAISQPEVVMRTDVVRRVGPVRTELPHTFDLHLWMQIAAVSDVGRINGPAQGYYRVHEGSLQRTVHAGKLFDLKERRAAFDSVFEREGASVRNASELHARARCRLAASALDEVCRAYDRGRTHTEPIDEYVSFAIETSPTYQELREWAALERRRQVGARGAKFDPRFFLDAVCRRFSEELSARRWLRTGEQ